MLQRARFPMVEIAESCPLDCQRLKLIVEAGMRRQIFHHFAAIVSCSQKDFPPVEAVIELRTDRLLAAVATSIQINLHLAEAATLIQISLHLAEAATTIRINLHLAAVATVLQRYYHLAAAVMALQTIPHPVVAAGYYHRLEEAVLRPHSQSAKQKGSLCSWRARRDWRWVFVQLGRTPSSVVQTW